jgi:hypothetical protein
VEALTGKSFEDIAKRIPGVQNGETEVSAEEIK